MLTQQDCQILSALITSDKPMTIYAISKETGISKTQIAKRMRIILHYGLAVTDGSFFDAISILKCDNCIQDILKALRELVQIIYEHHGEPIRDIKPILYYFIKNMSIEQV